MAITVKAYQIPGPLTSRVSRREALDGLERHPFIDELRKQGEVDVALDEVDGKWVASIAVAGPFPPSDKKDDSSGDSDGGNPFDKGDSGDDSSDDGSEEPSDDGSEGPEDGDPTKGDEKGDKGGDKHMLSEIHQLLQTIVLGLGLPMPGGPGDSMVPGADDPAGPPDPNAGPPGMGGPPPPGAGGPPPATAKEKKVLHPGDVPQGVTPLGSPAFASLREDHPWKHIAGQVTSFKVNQPLDGISMDEAQAELRSLAAESGFNVKQAKKVKGPEGEERIVASLSIY